MLTLINRGVDRLRSCALGVCLLLASQVDAAPLYQVTNLGAVYQGEAATTAYAINQQGHVAGFSTKDGAFLWTPEAGLTPIGHLPGGMGGPAVGLNDLGQVVGHEWVGGAPRAFIWSSATGMQAIEGLPGAVETYATAINNAGQVVGYSTMADGDHPFIWSTEGGAQSLGSLSGNPDGQGRALAINDLGQVVGSSSTGVASHSFIWTAQSGMQEVGLDTGGWLNFFNVATDINGLGQIAGTVGDYYGSLGYVYKPGQGITVLDKLPQAGSAIRINGLNDAGRLVGVSSPPNGSGTDIAVTWTEEEGLMRLGDLVDPADPHREGLRITDAVGINGNGQIIAQASLGLGYYQAVLLTPVPEPSALLLTGVGLCLIPVARRLRGDRSSR